MIENLNCVLCKVHFWGTACLNKPQIGHTRFSPSMIVLEECCGVSWHFPRFSSKIFFQAFGTLGETPCMSYLRFYLSRLCPQNVFSKVHGYMEKGWKCETTDRAWHQSQGFPLVIRLNKVVIRLITVQL